MKLDTDDFELKCDKCGENLAYTERRGSINVFDVTPCETCMENQYNKRQEEAE